MKSDFIVALTQLAAERNLPREIVLSAIEAALVSAYRKDSNTSGQNISVKLDPGTGDISVSVLKTVVEEITEPLQEILLKDARKIKPDAELDDAITTESIPHSAGRIAAQTAKQVVMQRLREAERELVFEEFADKEGEVFSVSIQRMEPRQAIVDLGRAEAILPISEQAMGERYRPGVKMKVLLQSVQRSSQGPELIVSRADRLLVKRLFEMEVPEIYNGAVEIVAIAREAGFRSKVAVRATQDGVDPVGSCVGLRGVRIQSIVNELQGEKVDVLEWVKDPAKFVANALSPSQVLRVDLDHETESAVAIVPDRQLSLAIGREGQNARLAAKLTGWNVDIRSSVEPDAAVVEKPAPEAEAPAAVTDVAPSVDEEAQEAVAEAEAVVAEAAEAEVALEPVVEESAEAPAVEEEETVEAPVAEVEVLEAEAPPAEAQAAEPEAVVEEAPTEQPVEEPLPPEALELLPDFEEPVEEEEAVPAIERSASIRDLPEHVWSLRRKPTVEPGQIRFAEDIAGLRGGVTARRGRQRGGGDQRARKRRPARRRR